MIASAFLLAQASSSRTYFEVMRLRQLDQWWHWALLALVVVAIATLVTSLYAFDSRQLGRGKRWVLLALRVFALLGVLVFFMDVQKRTEQKLIKHSRFALLVDTSQSMGVADQPVTSAAANPPATNSATSPVAASRSGPQGIGGQETRVAQVVRALTESSLLTDLQAKHDVTVYRFDETNVPTEVATFIHSGSDLDAASGVEPQSDIDAVQEVRTFWTFALSLFAIALIALILHVATSRWGRTAEGESWGLLVSIFALIVGVVLVAVASLRHAEIGPSVAWGLASPTELSSQSTGTSGNSASTGIEANSGNTTPTDSTPTDTTTATGDVGNAEMPSELAPHEVDWTEQLEPRGGSTRLGDSLAWLVRNQRGQPLAGIGIITDGNSNRGVEPSLAAQLASESEIPLYPIGIGSETPPRNVRLVDLDAPARVFPGDEFKMTGYVQSFGMQGRRVEVKLISRPDSPSTGSTTSTPTPTLDESNATKSPAGATIDLTETVEAELSIELGPDGTVQPIPFQVTPMEVGKRLYEVRVVATDDSDGSDNVASSKVQIVERKSRVLLVAGGPTREYRFVRNLLYRDKDVTVDVLLQTAGEGVAQESDEILFDLPRDAAAMYAYDCMVVFDPDWTKFDQPQLELIESWVAEKAGGLVCIAGPVFTASWAENRRAPGAIEIVRQLYPVSFYSMNAGNVQLGNFGSTTPWPLDITADGRATSFLSLTEEEGSAADVWGEFPGVYGYYPIREVKPAATVYARYSDPQKAIDGQLPPLIVGQFYGAGRVVFMGTGEMWRLRGLDNAYFERYYTKLIRFASEGRLLRDSNRGLLLVDKDRALRGDAISVRASVVDQQFQPLVQDVVRVNLNAPDGSTQPLELRRSADAEGAYAGRFQAAQAGNYELALPLPGDGEPVILTREVRVRMPNLEIERPQRNDGILTQLATASGGTYYVGIPAMLGTSTSQSGVDNPNTAGSNSVDIPAGLAAQVKSMTRETYLPGSPDREFEQRLMTWLMGLICGSLFLEWFLRRMNKLA